jgi:YVTN family beta-propeller protein
MRAQQDHHASAGHRSRTSARWRGAVVVVAAAALSLTVGTLPASAAGGYTVTGTIKVGTEPAGLAADPTAGTVYLANAGDGTVSVIDVATNKVTATIAVGTEPAGVAVDHAAGTVYVTNHSVGTVSVIDEATNKVTGTIKVGTGPAGVAVDHTTGTVYVTNHSVGTVSVIHVATNKVTGTIKVGTDPAGLAVDPTAGTVYVLNSTDGTVSVISAPRPAPVPTALTARIHLGPHYRFTLIAELTSSRRPVSGQAVSFSTGHTHLCAPLTNTHGVASCVLTVPQTLLVQHDHDSVFARYLGNTSYQPSATIAAPPTPGS